MSPYDCFKRLRNKLRKYHPEQIIDRCTKHVKQSESADEPVGTAPPWAFMLLTKWTLKDGELRSPDNRDLDDRHWNDLLLLFDEFRQSVELEQARTNYCERFFYFRKLAYQQFCYQWPLTRAQIARQRVLFGHLEPNHRLKQRFYALSGMAIEHFLEHEMMLYSVVVEQNPRHVLVQSFETVRDSYPAGTAARFLSALSQDLQMAKTFIETDKSQPKDVSLQFYEQTPFRKFPLLKMGENYTWFSVRLLRYAFQNLVYDWLRNDDAGMFMDKFGEIFERYVQKGFEYVGIPFLSEKTLTSALTGSGKVIDFLLADDDATVFVDAKGVEMGTLGHVSSDPTIITDKVKSSVIAGINQAFGTAKRIAERDDIAHLRLGGRDRYLLIITYKQHFLGSGRDFYNCIAKDRMDGILRDHDGVQWIPFENMYFLSVDEYELLIQAVKERKTGLGEAIRVATTRDSDSESRKLLFSQHLVGDRAPVGMPDYLTDEFDDLTEQMRSRFQ